MPWVRFNGTKGYFDMIDLLEDFPEIKLNFNLVPSLLVQIEEYANNNVNDPFITYFLKPASELNPIEKQLILVNFFMANWDAMVKPYSRYWQLLYKRGTKFNLSTDIDDLELSEQDYIDIQVWHNLSWFGFRARKKYPAINELVSKGRNFSEGDKEVIFQIQKEILKQIVPTYKKFKENGQIEITTTPFYHPIIPLLISTENAVKSSPGRAVPEKFEHPEDVVAQLEKAVKFYEQVFGEKPKGIWPSEGSVCPELIPLLRLRD